MWRILSILVMASFSIAAPQKNNLDSLITNIFGTPEDQQTSNPLISSSTPTTILGTENRPKQPEMDCECVPYYLCHNGSILQNGTGIIDIRFGLDDESVNKHRTLRALGPCDYLDVCCKPPDRIEKVTPSPPIEKKGSCGQRHPEGVGFRITGDVNDEAQFGEFPWMVAVIKEENIGDQKLNVYQCGGSLIHKQAVLTAAHCVQGKQPSELRIRAGEWDTQTKNEIFPHQDRNVQNVIIHEKFAAGTLYNDFAILILSEPLNLMENVDLVCLPEQNTVFDNSRCFASGWGKDKFGKEGHYQVILKKINLPVVPHNQCQDLLRKTRLGKYFILDNSFICAGGESDKDTCKGDGGSPLVCPSNNNPNVYLQAGIVAWGIGCGADGIPGVYANVASVRDWIDEQMAFYNLDNTVYQAQKIN